MYQVSQNEDHVAVETILHILQTVSFLPKNFQDLFLVESSDTTCSITILEPEKLQKEFLSHTGFHLIYLNSRDARGVEFKLSDKDYKSMIDKKMAPCDLSHPHDLFVHIIPALIMTKNQWLILEQLHELVVATNSLSNVFESGSLASVVITDPKYKYSINRMFLISGSVINQQDQAQRHLAKAFIQTLDQFESIALAA